MPVYQLLLSKHIADLGSACLDFDTLLPRQTREAHGVVKSGRLFGEYDFLTLRRVSQLGEFLTWDVDDLDHEKRIRSNFEVKDRLLVAAPETDHQLHAGMRHPLFVYAEFQVNRHVVRAAAQPALRLAARWFSEPGGLRSTCVDVIEPKHLGHIGIAAWTNLGDADISVLLTGNRYDTLLTAVYQARKLRLGQFREFLSRHPPIPVILGDELKRFEDGDRPWGHVFASTVTLPGYRDDIALKDIDPEDTAQATMVFRYYPGHEDFLRRQIPRREDPRLTSTGRWNAATSLRSSAAAIRLDLLLDQKEQVWHARKYAFPIIGRHTLLSVPLPPTSRLTDDEIQLLEDQAAVEETAVAKDAMAAGASLDSAVTYPVMHLGQPVPSTSRSSSFPTIPGENPVSVGNLTNLHGRLSSILGDNLYRHLDQVLISYRHTCGNRNLQSCLLDTVPFVRRFQDELQALSTSSPDEDKRKEIRRNCEQILDAISACLNSRLQGTPISYGKNSAFAVEASAQKLIVALLELSQLAVQQLGALGIAGDPLEALFLLGNRASINSLGRVFPNLVIVYLGLSDCEATLDTGPRLIHEIAHHRGWVITPDSYSVQKELLLDATARQLQWWLASEKEEDAAGQWGVAEVPLEDFHYFVPLQDPDQDAARVAELKKGLAVMAARVEEVFRAESNAELRVEDLVDWWANDLGPWRNLEFPRDAFDRKIADATWQLLNSVHVSRSRIVNALKSAYSDIVEIQADFQTALVIGTDNFRKWAIQQVSGRSPYLIENKETAGRLCVMLDVLGETDDSWHDELMVDWRLAWEAQADRLRATSDWLREYKGGVESWASLRNTTLHAVYERFLAMEGKPGERMDTEVNLILECWESFMSRLDGPVLS